MLKITFRDNDEFDDTKEEYKEIAWMHGSLIPRVGDGIKFNKKEGEKPENYHLKFYTVISVEWELEGVDSNVNVYIKEV